MKSSNSLYKIFLAGFTNKLWRRWNEIRIRHWYEWVCAMKTKAEIHLPISKVYNTVAIDKLNLHFLLTRAAWYNSLLSHVLFFLFKTSLYWQSSPELSHSWKYNNDEIQLGSIFLLCTKLRISYSLMNCYLNFLITRPTIDNSKTLFNYYLHS